MTLPDNNNPDPAPVVTQDPPDPQPQPSNQQSVNWEGRYKGLQVSYDKLQKKFDALTATHETTLGELEELRQGTKKNDGEKSTLQATIAQLEKDKAALQSQLDTASFSGERMKLIMGEFPDLAQWEAEGLLPTAGTIEELKPKLQTFQKKFDDTIGNNVKKKLQGSGPGPSGHQETNPVHSAEYIYTRLNQLAGHRTPEQEVEYQTLRDEWDALEENK